MIRDITIGQYYPADSRIHKLDPRVKIVCTLLYLISLFTFKSILGYVLATVFLFGCIKLSKVPCKFIVRGLKPIIILLLITVGFNLFLTPGGETLVHVGFIKITEYGLSTAVYMAIRLIYLIMGSSLMTLTTTPNSLTDGLEKLLHPLNKLHVPVHEISMMMSIALRFIPILLEETDKIMKAQIARGADMESGNLIQKAKAMIPILVPLFVSAFRRANDLAMAMEARCYRGGNGRTKMKPLIYKSADHMAYLITILYVVGPFAVRPFCGFQLTLRGLIDVFLRIRSFLSEGRRKISANNLFLVEPAGLQSVGAGQQRTGQTRIALVAVVVHLIAVVVHHDACLLYTSRCV